MNELTNTHVSPMTVAERKAFIESVVEGINEGTVHPIRLAVYVKSLEETVKAIKEHYQIKEAIQDAADLYPEKTFEVFGSSITKAARTTYNFAVCGDSIYNDMIVEQERLKSLIEARQAMLKTGINPETGETFPKPATSTTNYLTIKIR